MIRTSDSVKEISAALAKAQAEVKGAAKDSTNPFFGSKYADLASVWEACRPALTAQGIAVVQAPRTEFVGDPEVYTYKSRSGEERSGVRVATKVFVETRLCHGSGEWMEGEASAMLPVGDPQAVGSAITYLRRYALAAMVGVAPEDDDGEATTRPVPQRAAPKAGMRQAGPVLMSEAQSRKVWTTAKAKGLTEEQTKELVFKHTGKLSSKDVLASDVDAILRAIATWTRPTAGSLEEPPRLLDDESGTNRSLAGTTV